MKLIIQDGEDLLLKLEDHAIELPAREFDRARTMMLLSEALVLLANACEADGIEASAASLGDSLRQDMIQRLQAGMTGHETQH